MPIAPSEALSPRSINLPMKPPAATKKIKPDSRAKVAQAVVNPDKIDEKWRPADIVREPLVGGESYLTGKKLGRGGFAVCFEGRSEGKGELFALKVVKSVVEQKKQLEKFRTELQIHAKMHHPSIVEFHRAFAFKDHTYVVLELCSNGSLMDMVRNRKSLSLPEVRRYMIQLCAGVKYMHHRCVIHRDLKMGNLFIDSNMNVKIGDFGLAAVVVDDKERRQTMCGTPNYIAPELLARSSAARGHGHKVDTWAIGIICYAMLIGTPPFASKSQTEIYAKLKQLQYEWKEDCQYFIPPQAKDLVTLCLNLDPYQRPGMDELVEHEFFKMGAIAEQLSRSSLRSQPTWLQHTDPRGDKVTTGYGEDYATFCAASGVGKMPSGQVRPPIGGNVAVSAMVEVHLENAKGCAPIVPMPNGVIYRETVPEKEELNLNRKKPLATQVRSRKEKQPVLNSTVLASASAVALPVEPAPSGFSTVASQTLPNRAPVQSFAAQQRQQALPSQSIASRSVSIRSKRQPLSKDTDQVLSTQSSQRKISREVQIDTPSGAVADPQQSQHLLREQPLRAAGRVTRSASTRNAALSQKVPTATSDSGAVAIAEVSEPVKHASIGTSRPRKTSRAVSQKEQEQQNLPAGPSVTRPKSRAELRPVTANDRRPEKEISKESEGVASDVPKTSFTSSFKATIIPPTDDPTLVPGSGRASVSSSLHELYRELSPKNAYADHAPRSPVEHEGFAHPVVEKWVDYTDRYGIGYILSDGAAGLALRSSADNTKSSTCVVIRNAREHYARRIRQEDVQLVPQGPRAPHIEFYETLDEAGIRTLRVPARKFRFEDDSGQWIDGKDVLAHLSSKTHDSYSAERVRLIGLLDKFGKYMTGLDKSEEEDAEPHNASTSDLFVKFYQRLGNVGIWGFGNGSFQFNFPDHTKLIVYRRQNDNEKRLMLDLYHLKPRDALHLAKHGSFAPHSLEDRSSFTTSIADFLLSTGTSSGPGHNTDRAIIIQTNQIIEKLAWIRGVVGVWIREGGLGRTGKEKLAWSGLQATADKGKGVGSGSGSGRKARLVWNSVGRDGGDGELPGKVR